MSELLIQCQCLTADLKGNPRKENFLCAICLELPTRPVVLSCAHFFCYDCVDKAANYSNSCPVCRYGENDVRAWVYVLVRESGCCAIIKVVCNATFCLSMPITREPVGDTV